MVSPRRLIQFLLVLFTAGLVLPGRLRGSAFSVPYSNAHALRGGRWIPGRCAKGLRLSASPIVEAWLLQQERDKEYDELLRGGFSKDGLQRDEFWRSKPLLGEVVAKAKAITPRKNRFLDWEKNSRSVTLGRKWMAQFAPCGKRGCHVVILPSAFAHVVFGLLPFAWKEKMFRFFSWRPHLILRRFLEIGQVLVPAWQVWTDPHTEQNRGPARDGRRVCVLSGTSRR